MGSGLRLSSGRLIAVGRVLLAALLLTAIRLDISQPGRAQSASAFLLAFYIGFALLMLAATWKNWWLDAKLAGPSHAIDIAIFALLGLTAESATSPYYVFFVFLLLVAAIRWSWLATLLIALLLICLHLFAGLLTYGAHPGPDQHLLFVRTGQLFILAMIVVWFGANQWRARLDRAQDNGLAQPDIEETPVQAAALHAVDALQAKSGAFLWRDQFQGEFAGTIVGRGEPRWIDLPARSLAEAVTTTPFLYAVRKNRCLRKDANRNLVDCTLSELIGPPVVEALELRQGLAIPVVTEQGHGELFVEGVRGLSTDHLDVAVQVADAIATYIRRHALLRAVDETAEARSRVSLARDLHDSIVQFLAASAFRLEAMKRSQAGVGALGPELDQLKQLMLHEQRELRAFISALRGGSLVTLKELVADLRGLSERLSNQWGINCEISAKRGDATMPMRLHIDAHQLMREAVANAVRHAGATSVRVTVGADSERLHLQFVNNGSALRDRGGRLEMPASLEERVTEAGGEIDVSRGMDMTRLEISLPIRGRRR